VSSRPNKRILLPTQEELSPPKAKRAKSDTPSNGFQVPTGLPLPPAAPCRETRDSSKAVKNDDAIVPVWLWNDRIAARTGHDPNSAKFLKALTIIRKVALHTWKRLVVSSFWKWFSVQPPAVQKHVNTIDRGVEAIRHASLTSWWAWDKGPSPLFWRWPPGYQDPLRDGMKPMFKGDPPHTMEYQRPYSDEGLRSKEKKKIGKARVHGYLLAVFKILALINVFSVPKGHNNICMVYDGTKSGLNNMLFCPWFWLPTTSTMTRTLHKDDGTGDNDSGDFFLNFWQHLDLVPFLGEEANGVEKVLVAWVCCAMGLKPSPYYAAQCGNRAKRICLGSPKLEYSSVDPMVPLAY
jgi:hypothetical protein